VNPFESYDGSKYEARFFDALKLYRNSDFEGALTVIREIIDASDVQDVNRHKFRSYEGLILVCMGQKQGLALCREIAAEANTNVDVLYNLALAEYKLDNRRLAVKAVTRGLAIDANNTELLRLRSLMGSRRPPVISFLGRENIINVWLGRFTYRKPGKSGLS
jgi:tetratricopeptide (TPR) repeat protein